MSSRYLLKLPLLSVVPAFVPAFVLGMSVSGAALASADAPFSPEATYDSPLSAGTLTMEDVLEAHKPVEQKPTPPSTVATPSAPLLVPPKASSSTGLMMSQGMKAVLQDLGATPVGPIHVTPPSAAVLTPPAVPAPAPAAAAAPTEAGIQYQPGQEPKNLATSITAPSPSTTAAPALQPAPSPPPSPLPAAALPSLATATLTVPAAAPLAASLPAPPAATPAAIPQKTCDEHVQQWEKTCGDAGYPASYVGRINGETRTGCADGALHDVWVSNTCTPPEPVTAQSAKIDAVCGLASNNEFDNAPSGDLCAQGVASAVNGNGPWTWACSGINGGDAAACVAQKRIPARNGVCGSANGAAVAFAPSDSLCAVGSATAVTGSGPWVWACAGLGKGSSASCIAPLATPPVITDAAPVAAAIVEANPAPVATPIAPVKPAIDEARATALSHAIESTAKGELCGAAAETLAYEAPEKDLCRAGTPSVVNGSGPWSWSCTDNEGVSSSCQTLSLSNGDTSAADPAPPSSSPQVAVTPAPSAAGAAFLAPTASVSSPTAKETLAAAQAAAPRTIAAVSFSCGFSSDLPARRAPGKGLCKAGKPSAVRGTGPWQWTCGTGATKASCQAPKIVDAACGAVNGLALTTAPASDLCAVGDATAMRGTGPWQWSCKGMAGGASVSCAASLQGAAEKLDGTCGASNNTNLKEAPVSGLCNRGAASAVSGDGPWTWTCSGLNDGSAASCFANKIAAPQAPGHVVNGLCGTANGAISTALPAEGLCAGGDATTVVGNGPWNWDCIGENGGMTVSCTAPLEPPTPINGSCGSASGVATTTYPQSGLCSAGITGAVNGHGPWTWTCSGVNGGSPASCIAPVSGKTGALPSAMVLSAAGNPPPAIAHTGLTTPQLNGSFATAPKASPVPAVTRMAANAAPDAAPNLPVATQPLQPPALRDTLQPSKALKTSTDSEGIHIPGNRLTLDSEISTLTFEHGSGNISSEMTDRLDKLVTVLQANGDVRISLFAYADNADVTPRDARHLSLNRALAIRDYLEAKDIPQSRVDVHAEGANTSQAPMDRVDIRVNN